jgi:hypothetical protein
MMTMTGVRLSTATDCRDLSPRLRQADLDELNAFSGEQPEIALNHARKMSVDCSTMIIDHEIAGMFGITANGCVWMVSTDALPRKAKTFMRASRGILNTWLLQHRMLWNVVDERNTTHIRWLKHMGFTFTGQHRILHDPNVKFLEFYKCASPHS